VLNNGGKLIIIDFDKNRNISYPRVHNGFSHKELEETLHAVGFTSIQINTFSWGTYFYATRCFHVSIK